MTTLLSTLNSLCASYLVSLVFSFLSYKTETMIVPVALGFLRGLNRKICKVLRKTVLTHSKKPNRFGKCIVHIVTY